MAISEKSDAESLRGTTKYEKFPGLNTILITGGAGFIGGWVTRHFVVQYADQYNVVCMDTMASVSSKNNIACLLNRPNFKFVNGDITDQNCILRILREHDIDGVIHFAAESHVGKSFSDPWAFMKMNVLGTYNLLEAMRAHGNISRFVHASTDEVYGETHGLDTDETAAAHPTNPYAASKAAAEMYVMAYEKSYKIPAVMLRCNNVFGPCQFPEKIIPKFTKLMMNKGKLTIQGDGTRTRNFLYVQDVVDAYDTVLHRGEVGEVYNVSSSFNVSVRDVATGILSLFGYDPVKDFKDNVTQTADRPFNDDDYVVAGEKLKGIDWKQRIDFNTGLKASVDWYRKNVDYWWTQSPTEVNGH